MISVSTLYSVAQWREGDPALLSPRGHTVHPTQHKGNADLVPPELLCTQLTAVPGSSSHD